MVGSSVCLLAAAFAATTLVEHGHPSPLAAQLIGGGRTLAIASGLIAVGVGLLGGGGLGPITLEAARLQQYGLMWKGLLLILALALALDLILGLAQMIALTYSGDSGRPVTAGG
jgi:ABC-type nitrate/sulfonate/bicarbonate transport system permease component